MIGNSTKGPFGDIQILIAEDDRMIADVMARGLTARSFHVQTVDRVMDGLDVIAESDLLILDLYLLNGDGRQLLYKWVREKHQPVLVVSGILDPGDEEELITSGAWNVLAKPFKMDTLCYLAERYAGIIKDRRRSIRVERLEKRVRLLAFVIAAFGGVEIIPRLLSLFGINLGTLLGFLV